MNIPSKRMMVYSEGSLYVLIGLKPSEDPKSDKGGKPVLLKLAGGIPTVDSIPEGTRMAWAADVVLTDAAEALFTKKNVPTDEAE